MNAYKLDHLLNVTLFEELSSWLSPKLQAIHGSDCWWDKGVYSKLTENQRQKVLNQKKGSLEELDLLALLHVSIKNIRELNYHYKVPMELRLLLDSVRQARNELSHRSGGKLPESEDLLLHALNTRKVLQLLSASPEHIAIADLIIRSINDPDLDDCGKVTVDDLTGGKLKQLLDRVTSDSNKDELSEEKTDEAEIIVMKPVDEIDYKEENPESKNQYRFVEITEGLNELIPAVLTDCKKDTSDDWQCIYQ